MNLYSQAQKEFCFLFYGVIFLSERELFNQIYLFYVAS